MRPLALFFFLTAPAGALAADPEVAPEPEAPTAAAASQQPLGMSAEQLALLLRERGAGQGPDLEAIVVPVTLFGSVVVLVGLLLLLRLRQHESRQVTLRLMVEKGASIPPELLSPPQKPRSDLRRGVLLLSAGIGLGLFLALVNTEQPVWSLGLVPALVGAGHLLVWKIEPRPASGA